MVSDDNDVTDIEKYDPYFLSWLFGFYSICKFSNIRPLL